MKTPRTDNHNDRSASHPPSLPDSAPTTTSTVHSSSPEDQSETCTTLPLISTLLKLMMPSLVDNHDEPNAATAAKTSADHSTLSDRGTIDTASSRGPMAELLDSAGRRAILVSPEEHLDSATSNRTNGGADKEDAPDLEDHAHESETPQLRHVAKMFRDSQRMVDVNHEQIARVRMMHDRFVEGTEFSFNYNVLLLVAAILAALGLVSNSVATIIASMLVSPIMGPVVGLAYGTAITDWKMVKRSIKTECLSLVACIVIGALVGALTGWTSLADDWPTSEMESRGSVTNLLVGLPIAFFSGLGVAVSLLDDQVNSLVGVAISASLLPPAVNAGILWVAFIFANNDPEFSGNSASSLGVLPTNNVTASLTQIESYITSLDDEPTYGRSDYRHMGMISLLLTLANIALIWISGLLMFRLKEVLPIKKKIFWSELAVARKIYQSRAVLVTSAEDEMDGTDFLRPSASAAF